MTKEIKATGVRVYCDVYRCLRAYEKKEDVRKNELSRSNKNKCEAEINELQDKERRKRASVVSCHLYNFTGIHSLTHKLTGTHRKQPQRLL